jgi:hypothetical protein
MMPRGGGFSLTGRQRKVDIAMIYTNLSATMIVPKDVIEPACHGVPTRGVTRGQMLRLR